MTEAPVCLPPVRDTRETRIEVPAGSVDCHTHVFVDGYELSPSRGYTPPQSSLSDVLRMHAALRIDSLVDNPTILYGF